MKNLSFVLLLSLICTAITAQNQSYNFNSPNPEAESGKCYAQCFIPGDTITNTETILIRPSYKEPEVIQPESKTEEITYTVKEPCTTCDFTEEKSIKTQKEEVMVKPGYWKYFTSPCVWETVYDTVVVKEESIKYILTDPEFKDDQVTLTIEGVIEEGICTPAVTGTETGTIEIAEECTKIEVSEYQWVDEDFFVAVAAPTKRWVKRKAEGNCVSDNPDDCMIWCLEDIPAVKTKWVRKVKGGCPYGYEDNGEYCIKTTTIPAVTKDYEIITCEEEAKFEKGIRKTAKQEEVAVKVLSQEATYTKVVEEAEYEVIARRVVVEPAKLDSVYIEPVYKTKVLTIQEQHVTGTITATPAVTESCTRKLCVEPEVVVKIHEPIYKTVTKVKVTEGSFTQWQEVLCPSEQNSYTIGQIQNALSNQGYDPGPIDNAMGKRTKAALVQFQKNNDLPQGQLDLETLRALGIPYGQGDADLRD